MTDIKRDFPIWIGKNYNSGGRFGAKILVIGESTYSESGEDTSQYNILIPEDHIAGYRDAFRTKLARVFLNTDKETREDISEFWHSVAFFNFVSSPLDGPRKAPSNDMWKENSQFMESIVDDLRPNLIVILGYRMWASWHRNLSYLLSNGPKIIGAGREQSLFFGDTTLLYCLRHPSSAFSWRSEHPYLMEAINKSIEDMR